MKALREGTKLKAWRDEAGWSLGELAGVVGYSPAMCSRAERGLREFSPRAKVAIARRLGVSVADLFDPTEATDQG